MSHLDWHSSGVIADREEDPLAPHSLESGCEFDLGDGKGVAKVEATVHVGVGEGTEPFRVLVLNILH